MFGRLYEISTEKIKDGTKKFELTKSRMEIINTKEYITLINDAYNANYDSMKAAIEYLGKIIDKRKVAILGDMLELGEYEDELHKKIGEEIVKNKIDILITVGNLGNKIAKSAIKNGINKENVITFNETEDLLEKIENIVQTKDVILIKASNAMKFNKIVEKLNK